MLGRSILLIMIAFLVLVMVKENIKIWKITFKVETTPYDNQEYYKKFYNRLGYKIRDWHNKLLPRLEPKERRSCGKIFKEWLSIIKYYKLSHPPRKLTNAEIAQFTLNHAIPFTFTYRNDKETPGKRQRVWHSAYINHLVDSLSEETLSNSLKYYRGSAEAVYWALKHQNISGQIGLVIGSETPWAETFCLKNNAKSLITLDYIHVKTNHPQLEFQHAFEFAERYEKYVGKFDFVVSFSSIEHAGLGRYGDPLDPFGDVKEIQKAWCWLKKGGLFFLGIPIGNDHLTFNLHRIYGTLRLPMILQGYRLLKVFHGDHSRPIQLSMKHLKHSEEDLNASNYQLTFVLQKT